MTALIYWLSSLLSLPAAFWVISVAGNASAIAVYLWAADGAVNLVNLAISLFTMTIAQAGLVAGARSEIAIQTKLDFIIANMPGGNDAVGVENKRAEEIEEIKLEIEEKTE